MGRLALASLIIPSALLAVEPALEAKLKDPEATAAKAGARVEVKVDGLKLVDPASVSEKPMQGQGHIHYQVDGGPVIATTATVLGFHELTPGIHRIHVTLVGNDHKPIGPGQTLTVNVPPKSS
jgi:hypothetical protein